MFKTYKKEKWNLNIGIDIDDTITNSSDVYIKYAKKYNRISKINHNININVLEHQKSFGWDKSNLLEFNNKYLKIILSCTKVKPNVKKILKKFKNKNCKIILITARNNNEYKDMFNLTSMWLKKNKINYDKLIINSDDKTKECQKNNIDIFVDDSISNCENVRKKLNIPVFLFHTRYNKNYINQEVIRIKNWKDLYKKYKMKEKNDEK